MSDTFVPMRPAIFSGADHGFTPLPIRPAPFAAGKAVPGANGQGLMGTSQRNPPSPRRRVARRPK